MSVTKHVHCIPSASTHIYTCYDAHMYCYIPIWHMTFTNGVHTCEWIWYINIYVHVFTDV